MSLFPASLQAPDDLRGFLMSRILLSRRRFLLVAGLLPTLVAHHRPGHSKGPKASMSPTPSPSPPLLLVESYLDTYSEVY